MQLSGSFSQSVLHLNLSQLSQPIGGVRARPLSNAFVIDVRERTSNVNITVILLTQDLIVNDEILRCLIVVVSVVSSERKVI